MLQPFQKLLRCPPSLEHRSGVLLAASGPFIHSFSVQNGSFLATWPTHDIEGKPLDLGDCAANAQDFGSIDHERSCKRRRLSLSREASSSTSAEILVEDQSETGPNLVVQISNPDISEMICTSNGEYVIAATGEDKAIRVLRLRKDGSLIEISERHDLHLPLLLSFLLIKGIGSCQRGLVHYV